MHEPHTIVGKNGCFTMRAQHVAPEPRASSPDTAAVLPGAEATTSLLQGLTVLRGKEDQGAETTMFSTLPHVRHIVWRQLLLAGKVLLASGHGSVRAPRPAEDLKSQQKALPKTPEPSSQNTKRGAGWALPATARAGVR